MAKDRAPQSTGSEAIISIIGPGMRVVGDLVTDGTVRIEGTVEGSVQAGKGVVLGVEGTVLGSIHTQDAILSGTLDGTIVAESRLEVQASSRVSGEIRARRLQLEEGALLNGQVLMGEEAVAGGHRGTAPDPHPPQDDLGAGGSFQL